MIGSSFPSASAKLGLQSHPIEVVVVPPQWLEEVMNLAFLTECYDAFACSSQVVDEHRVRREELGGEVFFPEVPLCVVVGDGHLRAVVRDGPPNIGDYNVKALTPQQPSRHQQE